jgi:hypothetical protein
MRALAKSTKMKIVAAAFVATAGAVVIPAASATGSTTPGSVQDKGPVADATCTNFVATNSALQKKVVSNIDAGLYSNTGTWQNMDCGSTTVNVPRGQRALVVAKVDAEVSCQGPNFEWCLGRVLINGVPGRPNSTEADGSFAWATARPDLNQWESNAFSRTWTVSCPSTATTATCSFPVVTQVMNHTSGMWFRVDDSTLDVQTTYM